MPAVASDTAPFAPTLRRPFWSAEMVRFEVEAVPVKKELVALMAVLDAYGRMDAVFDVAVKLDAVGVVEATTTPLLLVARRPFWILEMVRFDVEAVPE